MADSIFDFRCRIRMNEREAKAFAGDREGGDADLERSNPTGNTGRRFDDEVD